MRQAIRNWLLAWIGLAECAATLLTLGFFNPNWVMVYLVWELQREAETAAERFND